MTLKVEIMNLIAEQLDEMFGKYFNGKAVAVTFAGEIVAIEDEMVVLLKRLQKEISQESVFVHIIGSERY